MREKKPFDSILLRIKSLLVVLPFIGFALFSSYALGQYVLFDTTSIKFSSTSIKVFDRERTFLWEISRDNAVKSTPIKIKDVPVDCVNAIISVEDRYFWNNIGIDLNGLGRLGISVFTGEYAGGGSTITQQLIKVSNERIYDRNPVDKLNEIIQAIKLSNSVSKSDILEMYLNNVFFGNLNYGIESASQDYFKKSTKDLNLAECSYLAGIPQWPGVLNPYGDLERAKERQKIVLGSMVRNGYITSDQGLGAFNEELNFQLAAVEVKAPHYVQFLSDVVQGETKKTPNLLELGDLSLNKSAEVTTTYSYSLHKKTLELSKNVVDSLSSRNVNNAAVIILDSENNLVTMIGSVNYFNDDINGKFNSALGLRQPGSAFIPYLYSYAFTKDKNPDTAYSNNPFLTKINRGDKEVEITIKNLNGYTSNSETLRNSLAYSYQIPSVLLTKDLQNSKVSEGFHEFEVLAQNERSGCSDALVIEGCEKTLLDLTYFYSSLKNKGVKTPITTISTITPFGESSKSLLNTNSTLSNLKIGLEITNSLISSNSNSWKIYNGDTDNLKDQFSFGYNDKYTVGVWTGNTKGETTVNVKASESAQVILENISNYINSIQ